VGFFCRMGNVELRVERDQRLRRVEKLIDMMRPAVESDGGALTLIECDPEAGRVVLRLEGACGTCALSESNTAEGIERVLRSRLPWVKDVVVQVDTGTDPGVSSTIGRGSYVPKG
jgi:Fe-S cluster biogenesis protein NfuA